MKDTDSCSKAGTFTETGLHPVDENESGFKQGGFEQTGFQPADETSPALSKANSIKRNSKQSATHGLASSELGAPKPVFDPRRLTKGLDQTQSTKAKGSRRAILRSTVRVSDLRIPNSTKRASHQPSCPSTTRVHRRGLIR